MVRNPRLYNLAMEQDPSVSVDVEESDGVPSSGGRSGIAAIGGAVILLVAVAIAFFALRPGDGETAAGSDREDGTEETEEAVTSESTAPPTTVPAGPPQFEALPIIEAVRTGDGFLGLIASSGIPALFTTEDGDLWTQVEPTVSGDVGTGSWSNLIAVDEGFALLRTRGELSTEGDLTERFISANGVDWELDGQFQPLDNQGDSFFPEFHLPEVYGFVAFSSEIVASPLEGLFAQVLVEDAPIDPSTICFFEEFNADQFDVFPCDTDGETSTGVATVITAEQLVDPESIGAVQQCAAFIRSLGSTRSASMVLQRSGQGATVEVEGSFSTFQTALPSGAIASVFLGDRLFAGSVACDDFAGAVPEFLAAEIELVDLDGTVRRIPLPDDVPQPPQTPAAPFATDSELVIVLEQSIWRLDLESEEWTMIAELPPEALRPGRFAFADSSRAIALLDPETLISVDLASGEISESPVELGRFPQILHIDSEFIVARDEVDEGRVDVVELP